jgi:N6-L-threonylcarbamoyladenine synthase
MSFAGLKSAVARAAEGALTDTAKADICASFQAAICDVLSEKSARALAGFDSGEPEKRFVVAGGVAANTAIRTALELAAAAHGARLIAPPLRHCTDNAAMIALAGAERLAAGMVGEEDGLAAGSRPRWPLDEAAALAAPVYGGGHKGAKA